MIMGWQSKLSTLVEASKQGHPDLRLRFRYGLPLDAGQVGVILHDIAQEFELGPKVVGPLHDLYGIVDGLNILGDFKILGLSDGSFAFGRQNDEAGKLRNFNHKNLQILKECIDKEALEGSIALIFGSDEVGDNLSLCDNGTVVIAGYNTPQPQVIAHSLDEFLDDICMGSGFARYYEADDNHPWVLLLEEFGFL